jgi:hypothetical protein
MQLQTKEHLELPEVQRIKGGSPLSSRKNPVVLQQLDYKLLELSGNKFLLCWATWFVVICYSNHRKLIYHLSKISFLPELLSLIEFLKQGLQTSVLMDWEESLPFSLFSPQGNASIMLRERMPAHKAWLLYFLSRGGTGPKKGWILDYGLCRKRCSK